MNRIDKSKISAFALSFLFAILLSGTAYAACGPNAVRGKWSFHGVSYDGAITTTLRCNNLVVRSDGTVRAGSKCFEKSVATDMDPDLDGDGFEEREAFTSDGELTVKRNCAVEGGFGLDVDAGVLVGEVDSNIDSARISKNRQIVSGVGTSTFSGTLFGEDFESYTVIYFTMNRK